MSFDRMDQMDWTYGRAMSQAQRGTIVGQVMGLLAFSLLFTAGGYLVGRALGPLGMILGIVGSIASVLALSFARTKMSSGLPWACSTCSASSRGWRSGSSSIATWRAAWGWSW